MVRFEVDAYFVPQDPPLASVDELATEIASRATISERPTSTHVVDETLSLTVIAAGKPIANESPAVLFTDSRAVYRYPKEWLFYRRFPKDNSEPIVCRGQCSAEAEDVGEGIV